MADNYMIKYIIMKHGLLHCKGICSTQLLRNNSFLMNVFVKVAVVCHLLWPREICLTAFLERNPNTETPDEYDMRAHFASLRVRLSPHTRTHTHALLSLYSLISPHPHTMSFVLFVNLFTCFARLWKSYLHLGNFTETGFRKLVKGENL